jgi:hypothetical protein
MKNQSGALLYFSGYPLRIANAKQQKLKETNSNLTVIQPESQKITRKNNIADNPKNWDEGWFCNYE